MRLFVWLVRAFIFFTLFAFALNNQHEASVKWFFGEEWRTPMVFIVLGAFSAGCAFGVFAMMPRWWKQRRIARHLESSAAPPNTPPVAATVSDVLPEHPPRDEL